MRQNFYKPSFYNLGKKLIFIIGIHLLCYTYSVSAYGQGTFKQQPAGTTSAYWGYYEYLPKGYTSNGAKSPVLITLHGVQGDGNGKSDLPTLLQNGIPGLLSKNKWPANRPLVIISPQSYTNFFNRDQLYEFIKFVKNHYNIDPNRIYLTGQSGGAISIWSYLAKYQDQVAAVVPVAGNGISSSQSAGCKYKHIPIWAFHGNKDNTVHWNGSIKAVEIINSCNPKPQPKAKVTIYAGVGHNSWDKTYDLSGMSNKTDSQYDPYDVNIYDWMLSHKKGSPSTKPPKNSAPSVDACDDVTAIETQNSVVLTCEASDSDGNIVSHQWKKLSGPSVNLQGENSAKLTVSKLVVGTYEFQVTVKDNDGANASDKVKVKVNADDSDDAPGNGDGTGLAYRYYEGNWSKLPAFSELSPIKKGTVANFSLSPKKRSDKFGFRFDGYIEISKAGTYTFYTSSDDGSTLEINGRQIVNNDGLHAPRERSGKVTLSKGYHAIRVRFFENSSGETLVVKYAGPGMSKQNIPSSKLYTSKPSSAPESPSPEDPSPIGEQGLAYRYYEGNWSKLPAFSKLSSVKKGTVANFSLSPRERSDKFGFRFDGYIEINKAGTYTFYTSSDDGSTLEINGRQIVNNDGTHGTRERSGKVKLSEGYHAIRVRFFEKSQGQTLIVKYAGPGISKSSIPNGKLYTTKPSSNARQEIASKGGLGIEEEVEETFYPESIGEINIFPNPVAQQMHIRLPEISEGNIQIGITDLSGAEVHRGSYDLQYKNEIDIDFSRINIPPGLYILNIKAEGREPAITKFIKE
uniref:PA14 domain-containing protein n=1 Tax=Roseihalotalea indica TaxID=2867963 RepID=A0AA49JHH5_9BACT|nr:PA14 domain-containing protein [Tunicatimonas sp. TK19036]